VLKKANLNRSPAFTSYYESKYLSEHSAFAIEKKMASKISTNDYLTAIKYRRTVYGLNDKSPVPDERILEIIKEVALTSPSSYNTQPGRIIVLLGAPHKKLWDIISEVAVPIIKQLGGEDAGHAMSGRFQGFKGKIRYFAFQLTFS
jgi:predicted oxidoreductase (fatty acid repression mutant protein)